TLDALRLQEAQITDRKDRLTDALLDGKLEETEYRERKERLLTEHRLTQERIARLSEGDLGPTLEELLELAGRASLLYSWAGPAEKRLLLQIVTSNLRFDGNNLAVMLAPPFSIVARRAGLSMSAPKRDKYRTLDMLLSTLDRSRQGMAQKS